MELLKKVSDILKKVAGITTILLILSETFQFLSSKIDSAIQAGEQTPPKAE